MPLQKKMENFSLYLPANGTELKEFERPDITGLHSPMDFPLTPVCADSIFQKSDTKGICERMYQCDESAFGPQPGENDQIAAAQDLVCLQHSKGDGACTVFRQQASQNTERCRFDHPLSAATDVSGVYISSYGAI
jgi:hypothetical protein